MTKSNGEDNPRSHIEATSFTELTEKAWQVVSQRSMSNQPMNQSMCLVLEDGTTYSVLQNCTIISIDWEACDRDGVDTDLEVEAAVKDGQPSKYIKLVTRFS